MLKFLTLFVCKFGNDTVKNKQISDLFLDKKKTFTIHLQLDLNMTAFWI